MRRTRTIGLLVALAAAGSAVAAVGGTACDVETLAGALGIDLDRAKSAATLASVGFARPVRDTVPAGDEVMLGLYEDRDIIALDVSDARAPKTGAEIATAGRVIAVDVDEEKQLAYAVDATGTVSVIAVRSALGASVLLSVKLPDLGGAAKGISLVGDRVIVLGEGRLHTARVVFEEDEPTGISADATTPVDAAATALAGGGDQVFLALPGGQVRAFTVPLEGAPVQGPLFSVGGDIRSLLAKGSRAIVLAKDVGLKVVDFGAAAPSLAAEIGELKDVASAKLFGRTLAVGLTRGSFHTIDLSDFASPKALTTNKGELPKFLALQAGNLVYGSGKQAQVAGIPPVVSASVPALQREEFPVAGSIPVTFSKPIDPTTVTVGAIKLTCNGQPIAGIAAIGLRGLSIMFRPDAPLPQGASCTLDLSGVRDAVGLELGVEGRAPQVTFKTARKAPAPVANAGSSYPHTADGAFTDWKPGTERAEWFDVTPARGMYSYFYADFDGQNLWLLNDWFFNDEKINPDCYNQFQAFTGGGKEVWDIRAYGNKRVEVRKGGKLVDTKATGVEGGYSFGPSPNVSSPHTMYELKIPASPGRWGVRLHDPGPTFRCNVRMGDPAPLQGGLGDGAPRASSVDYARLVAPAAPVAATPETGSTGLALQPTLSWTTTNLPDNFVSFIVEIGVDESLSRPIWRRETSGTSLALPRGLLVNGTTYFWRVRAWNSLGTAQSATFKFTTQVGDGPVLTVTSVGPGSVTSEPAGINCGSTCTAAFSKDLRVTLLAVPNSGATFVGWSGACVAINADAGIDEKPSTQASVLMDANKECTATFRGPADAGGDATSDASVCSAPVICSGTNGGSSCQCYTVFQNKDYVMNCTNGFCSCNPALDGGQVEFQNDNPCLDSAYATNLYVTQCKCP